MMLTIYHNQQEEKNYPAWIVVSMDADTWEEDTFYFTVLSGFEHKNMDDFPEGVLSFPVYQEDLILPNEKNGEVGIYLPPVKRRIAEQFPSVSEVAQLLIRGVDLEEVLILSKQNQPRSLFF